MAFKSAKQFSDAVNASGRMTTFRKVPTQTTGAGVWFDLSMSPGNPKPNYYVGAEYTFTPMAYSTNTGIYHGGNVAPLTKHVSRAMMLTATSTAVPLPVIFMDYLGFYSFIDESDVAEVPMINGSGITRYTDGNGVQIMGVVVAGHSGAAGIGFTVKYCNQAGVEGRVTTRHTLQSQVVNGTVITKGLATSGTPFLTLQAGDTGVRYIQSITMEGTGDVGLMALVLVKPIFQVCISDNICATEVEYLREMNTCPIIKDDAYLNAICLPNGTLSGAIINGLLETCWG